MPRIDDFKQARTLVKKELSDKEPDFIANFSGALFHSDHPDSGVFSLNFLNRKIAISWPALEFSYEGSTEEISIQQQVLLLHYLYGTSSSSGAGTTGEWISFQDVPDGRFYMGAFIKRAKDPLLKTFGDNPKLMIDLASKAYGASPLDYGDFSVKLKALPLVPVALVLWEGDDDFPPEGNILFDKNIPKILSAEDIAWLAGMVVYPLMGMANK
ncbi:DUF3786 domain-containing protein [Thermodesulfobacteriota bacterium]